MKIDRLSIVADAIDAHPKQFKQFTWGDLYQSMHGSVCGSPGCVAGFAEAIWGEERQPVSTFNNAREILGLTLVEAERLFASEWPVEWLDGERTNPARFKTTSRPGYAAPNADDAPGVLRKIADGVIKL